MHQTKLIHQLSLFDRKEMRQAEQFLQSPYHNSNETLTLLFKHLKRYHPALDSKKLRREIVFEKIFPGQPFDDHKLRKVSSKLNKLLEKFAVLQQLQQDELLQKRLLIEHYSQRDDYAHFEREVKQQISTLEKYANGNSRYYLELWRLYDNWFSHPESPKHIVIPRNFTAIIDYLDLFYVSRKLRYSNEANQRQRILKENIDIRFLKEILIQEDHPLFQEDPTIQMFIQLLHLADQSLNEELFIRSIQYLEENQSVIPKEERGFILKSLTNYGINYYNNGHKNFLTHCVGLNKLAVNWNQHIFAGKISPSFFLSAIITASIAKDFTWAKSFILNFQQFLKEDAEQVVRLCWAYWHYHNGMDKSNISDLDTALDHLVKIPYTNISIDLRIRSLQLRIYYEKSFKRDQLDFFISFADAFDKYIKRNTTISVQKAESYHNFILLAKRLAHAKINENLDQNKINALQMDISNKEPLILKSWLREKIEELIND